MARSMDIGMDKMVAMMDKMEDKCNVTLWDMDMHRMALQERLAQMQVNMELEMAKIFVNRDR